MNVQEFYRMAVETVAPFYETNDLAHRIDHANAVASEGIRIFEMLDSKRREGITIEMVLAAAYYHDIRAECRDEHHVLSAKHVRESDDELLKMFTPEQREQIALACAEHRSSFKGEYSGMLSKIINAADRGPLDFAKYFLRSYQYARSKCGKSVEDSVWHAVDHAHDKFGPNGYAIQTEVWEEAYMDSMAAFREQLAAAYEALPEKFNSPEEAMEFAAKYRGFTCDLN